jgi:hypothetical protein
MSPRVNDKPLAKRNNTAPNEIPFSRLTTRNLTEITLPITDQVYVKIKGKL